MKLYLDPVDPAQKKDFKKKTAIKKKTLNPSWDETITYDGLSAHDIKTKRVQCTMWDWDIIGSNDFMGGMSWSLADIMVRIAVPLPLMGARGHA